MNTFLTHPLEKFAITYFLFFIYNYPEIFPAINVKYFHARAEYKTYPNGKSYIHHRTKILSQKRGQKNISWSMRTADLSECDI